MEIPDLSKMFETVHTHGFHKFALPCLSELSDILRKPLNCIGDQCSVLCLSLNGHGNCHKARKLLNPFTICFINFCVRLIVILVISHFGFEGRTLFLIALVPIHCLYLLC